jgi:hypothetical protein
MCVRQFFEQKFSDIIFMSWHYEYFRVLQAMTLFLFFFSASRLTSMDKQVCFEKKNCGSAKTGKLKLECVIIVCCYDIFCIFEIAIK